MAEPAAATTGHGGMLATWAGLALLHLAFAGRIGWADVVIAILSGGAAALLVRWVDRASGCHFHHHPDWVLLA